MTIADNIKKLRKNYDLSQKELAEIAHVTDKAVSSWEKGNSEPRMGAIQRMADHFGILKSSIIEENGIDNLINIHKHQPLSPGTIATKGASMKVPIYGSISAGIPFEMISADNYKEIPAPIAKDYPNAFLLQIEGDSMNKLFPSGTYALIDPCTEVNNGEIAAVDVNGCEATLKRFFKLSNGIALEPESYNPEHSVQFFDCRKGECEDIRVLGKLVWHMAPFNIRY
ncbi:XRE family transcriptional regulator [Bacillus thuringiensis]|uniref:LexA repressor n=1 Tax=Bacillus thuringiensis TaxID=1428 RepID=A0A9X6TIL7_BACTU|nr:XRE family transcriptional regulator [Bacillus thuringiensis]PEA87051.1 LexA repressor [Bacillus thuringiensis]